MTKRMALVVLALAMVAGGSLPAFGQADLKKTLIGRWEGDIQQPRGRVSSDRTLVIDSVSGQDWKGRFGVTGKGLNRVTGQIDSTGPLPVIKFKTDAGSRIALRLRDEKSMEGTIDLPGTGQGPQDHPMRLAKVEKKTEKKAEPTK